MNKLKMKAKAGVTLIELLVVVLIVTILSVSLLPLLKPFVVEAQYAAEAIPVIGNIRTKIGVYQYDKGQLPHLASGSTALVAATNSIETWSFSDDGVNISEKVTDKYVPIYRQLQLRAVASNRTLVPSPNVPSFFGTGLDVDNQELAGKRCRPVHFQYSVIKNGASYCYVIGCFGDNNGLPEGTGYAVCEICTPDEKGHVHKKIGTWKRYKAATQGQLTFGTISQGTSDPNDKKASLFCPVPEASLFDGNGIKLVNGRLSMITALETWGWEFN